MKQLYTKDGVAIVGTLEHVPCCANVQGWNVIKGLLEPQPEYAGGSDMYWDDSTTQKKDGVTIVVDENGDNHLITDCVFKDDEVGDCND